MTKRTYQHIIDTKSIKKVLSILPDHWVVRELTERDYGTDLLIEIFNVSGKNKNGRYIYESTGSIINIQVKGTDSHLTISGENTVDIRLHRKNLLYFEKFAVPFLLLRVDVSSDSGNIYFVWLQKYIKQVLDQESPDWRSENRFHTAGKKKGEIKKPNYKIRIPTVNVLDEKIEKIEKIGSRIKLLEEFSEFIEIFDSISRVTSDIQHGHFHADNKTFDWIINEIKKIKRLNVLLKYNNCNISERKIEELLFHFSDAKATDDISNIDKYPYKQEFEMLLETEPKSMLFQEEFEYDMCGTIFY